ncbi:MAG: Re/Si-specific NAD(P)(+) transhydrogenase subunit alpha [Bacteroidota bacterium]
MVIGVLKETAPHEKRVACTPDVAAQFIKKEHQVLVEQTAGLASSFPDATYEAVQAQVTDKNNLLSKADLILAVQTPDRDTLDQIREGTILICFVWALQNPALVDVFKEKGITVLAMEAIPRISRAQNMDALSSMGNIAGYKSALIAAETLDRYLPMMMTAAGTIPPAKAMILGAGVAGLQAIATCKRLGAVVEAFDVRPAVKEQVESLGAKFIDVPLDEDTETKGGYAKELSKDAQQRQREVIHEHAKKSDIIITTALIPGKPAPLLITKEMVADMKPGSVIVDMAAETGGNCAYTQVGETVLEHEVNIVGPVNLPSQLANHASLLYAKNMLALLNLLVVEGKPAFNFEDEIILNTTLTHQGEIISPMLKS